MIGGTACDVKGGNALIGGTVYAIKKGRMLKDGTGYDISFAGGTPLSELRTGDTLYINENGSPVPFYVMKHDYESGLNGAGRTLVVREECYDLCAFDRSGNDYADSELDTWLCRTYLSLLDSAVQAALGTTKFSYTPGTGGSVTTLERAVFQLSVTELGKTAAYTNTEGSALPYAAYLLQRATMNGSAVSQWTRTPKLTNYMVYCLSASGSAEATYPYEECGSRPVFTLPGTTDVQDNGDGTYSLAG